MGRWDSDDVYVEKIIKLFGEISDECKALLCKVQNRWLLMKGRRMDAYDTIICRDKEGAKNCIDSIGSQHISDWEYLEDGKVRLILNCKLKQLKEQK